MLGIPLWLYLRAAAIELIKAGNMAYCYALGKEFLALHTVMNKITGALLVVLPLTLSVIDLRLSASAICAAATFAAERTKNFYTDGKNEVKLPGAGSVFLKDGLMTSSNFLFLEQNLTGK
ncbi:MAG: hypothetical protein Q4F00_09950 [bacterium]|nr:hypothetical protein [bacterium]